MRIPGPRTVSLLAASALLVGAAGAAAAQRPAGGALDALVHARSGRLVHYASDDPEGGNDDFRVLAPGETLTLMDHRGAGIVRRWWLTIAPRANVALQRQLIVRAYWDDEPTPSVEVPVADFFGMGFGEWHDYVSLPLSMTSGGYTSYWAMPFRRRGRLTVENRAAVPVERFYYNVDVETMDGEAPPAAGAAGAAAAGGGGGRPADVLYFHAQFRRATSEAGRPVTVLEATGRGHYAGTLLAMQPRYGRSLGYLEGDERVFVDGDSTPSVIGTGTEDYFNSGWYFDTGPYSAPYHGAPIVDTLTGRVNAYRWHIEDPIPFTRRLRFTIEHGGTNDAPNTDYSSVAYWYQTHPHAPFPPLPAELLPVEPWRPRAIPGMLEAEALVADARVTAGVLQVQDMGGFETPTTTWSQAKQLWWVQGQPGARLTMPLRAPTAGDYELVGYFTRAQDYGNVRLSVNGRVLSPLVEGYAPSVAPTGPVSFGRVPLRAGVNQLVVALVGKDPRAQGYSGGYLVGIDGFRLVR